MDLLCEPQDPVTPKERTPYVCVEEWDGGEFRTYAHRKGKTRILPGVLRHISDVPPADQPYLEGLYPTPRDELQPFIQTWLFFGLLAEALALNQGPSGERLIDVDTTQRDIAKLHNDFARCENDTEAYLDARDILAWGPLFRERLDLAPDRAQRMSYLNLCLQYTMVLLNATQQNIDHTVRYSINALGELFFTGIHAVAALAQPRIELAVLVSGWHIDYIKAGGLVEKRMLDQGWCRSEIERIRCVFQGLNTMHYTSQLRRAGPRLDHTKCSLHSCSAFQIDLNLYKPRHVQPGCPCDHIEADSKHVTNILRSTGSYPVIEVEVAANLADMKLHVEEYQSDRPYVALSHVWADGLGNPAKTSLPRCQIAKIATLIANLPPDPDSPRPLRMWLDTLCCPIEHDDKMISLERIADVYRQAHHVLVLDASLTAINYEGAHPAELLIRTFGCSPWMRRLWTLQEAALARTLQIQFKDRAASNMTLLSQLWVIAREHAQYMRIWQDINNEFAQLLGFSPKAGPENMRTWPRAQISTLQRAIHYRTVSVPSDEALCISTLMNLSTKYVAAGADGKQRMIRVWQQLAERNSGISSRVVFYVNETIDQDGWRWAPNSLLAASVADPFLSLDEHVVRFADTDAAILGVPTSLGLVVKVPGYRLRPKPLTAQSLLHPWPEVIHSIENQIILRDGNTGTWMRIIDWYRSKKLASWTREQLREFDRRESNPMCKAIDTGTCALLLDQQSSMDGTNMCRLVQVTEATPTELKDIGLDPDEYKGTLKARQGRAVILSPLTTAEGQMMNKVRDMAIIMAQDKATIEFQAVISKCDSTSFEWQTAEKTVRARIKEMVAEWWAVNTDIQQTMKDTVGMGMDEFVWVLIPKLFSHDVILERAYGQAWIVD